MKRRTAVSPNRSGCHGLAAEAGCTSNRNVSVPAVRRNGVARFAPAIGPLLFFLFPALPGATRARGEDWDRSVETLAAVRDDGAGNAEAATAWADIVKAPTERLVDLLVAMDDAGPLGRNWLRCAVDTVAARAMRRGEPLPLKRLERYLLDTRHDPRGRRLAYEWIERVDPGAAEQLLPKMLDDPSVELRRDAVARLIESAESALEKDAKERSRELFRRALTAARDKDQVETAAEQLRKLGESVDLPRHFGFLTDWKLIAPFDNSGRAGFDAVYPPEKELIADARYAGKNGEVSWRDYHSDDDFGMVDFNVPYGKLKEVVGYAWTTFHSPSAQTVELRLGCKNAWKLWLNGRLVFQREEYHRGMQMDQYRLPVRLSPGVNTILLKACQNEQQEDWTVEWQFQLRVCDATGTAVLSESRDSK